MLVNEAMRLRSLLFVPGDRPDRFAKAATSGADAVILDLEDSVAPERKTLARSAVRDWLGGGDRAVPCLVRINPLGTSEIAADLTALAVTAADGIVLPKSLGATSVDALLGLAGRSCPPILPICAETPAAVFSVGDHGRAAERLVGLTWGAEDLSAILGTESRDPGDGSLIAPLEIARALMLFAAHAASVPAIETVFPDIADEAGLVRFVARARGHGFAGMLAIHPAQVAVINRGFSPSDVEIEAARAIVDAFAASPGAGALRLNGRMVDQPHLALARALLARAGIGDQSRERG